MSGIEPEAFRMRNGRSTTELHPLLLILASLVWLRKNIHAKLNKIYDKSILFDWSTKFWRVKKIWRCRGLNPRPSVCETDALPLSYIPSCLNHTLFWYSWLTYYMFFSRLKIETKTNLFWFSSWNVIKS
jgi:hypothetical protein